MPIGNPVSHAVCDLCGTQFDAPMIELERYFYPASPLLTLSYALTSEKIKVEVCCKACAGDLLNQFSKLINERKKQ